MRKTLALLSVLILVLLSGCGAKEAANAPSPNESNGEQKTSNASVPNPDGIIAKEISVPDPVLVAAKSFVKQEYDFWCDSSGVTDIVDGKEQMVGEPAIYDNWKIEQIEPCYHYDNLEGRSLELYRLSYRIHTTTPDRIMLAGAMEIDPEGWMLTTYPNCTYLVFSLDKEKKPVYLFPLMENDCQPGDELFTSDLTRALQNGTHEGLA